MELSGALWLLVGASLLVAQPAPWRPVFQKNYHRQGAGRWVARPPLWTRGPVAAPAAAPVPEAGAGTTGNPYVTPNQMRAIYGIVPPTLASTIAIVDAYDAPRAERDLGQFSGTFGLPECTSSNGCFTKVNQTGGSSYPSYDDNWEMEISLDVQWVHAIAPHARILLVEANSDSDVDLFAAVNYARRHAAVVSMSWGDDEWYGQHSYDTSVFSKPGATFVAASGDTLGELDYPATSPYVIAVGGTSFATDFDGLVLLPVVESAWSDDSGGTGGGCSTVSEQPAFQARWVPKTCTMRGVPDVAMDADPASGVPVYISSEGGWWVLGGTSLSCPMFAALLAQVNVLRTASLPRLAPLSMALADLYSAADYNYGLYFKDITSGGDYGDFAAKKWDFLTGLGSPRAKVLMPYLENAAH